MKARNLVSDREIWNVHPDMTVLDVARYMTEKKIGAVVVVDGGLPIGLFSERDLMERVVSEGRSPEDVPVRDVMTTQMVVASPDETHLECVMKMQQRGCRHLPLVEDDQYVGMLSLRDLLRVEVDEKDETIRWMHAYIHDVQDS